MKFNLYYAPYPAQIFRAEQSPISTERLFNPKSALTTLVSGTRSILESNEIRCSFEIIDMQLSQHRELYKTIKFGEKLLDCYRTGIAFEEINYKIKETNYHAISSNFTNGAQIVVDFAKHVKKTNKDAIVVVGGTDATSRPNYYIDNGVDYVIKGEGEVIFAKLISCLAKGDSPKDIPNICTKHNKFDLRINKSFLLDLNEIPPMALDLVKDISLYNDTGEGEPPVQIRGNYVCFESSRGCMNTCSFCTSYLKGKYRFMRPESVKKHFDYFKSHNINTILFQEDNILSRLHKNKSGEPLYPDGRKDTIEIFKMAREYGFSWEFANGVEFGKLIEEDLIDYELMEALFWNEKDENNWKGCYRVQIPLEYLSDEPSTKFTKLIDFNKQLKILEVILKMGVNWQTYNVIIGFLDDTHESIEKYRLKCQKIKDHLYGLDESYQPYFNIFNLTLLPGTPDYKKLYKHFKYSIDENPEMVGVYLSGFSGKHISNIELFHKRIEMIESLNGELIYKYDGIFF